MTMTVTGCGPISMARAPSRRSRATSVGAARGEQQRLVADVARHVGCWRSPNRAPTGARRSRASAPPARGRAAFRRSHRWMASGVLPVPPAVKLPTQMTGSRDR